MKCFCFAVIVAAYVWCLHDEIKHENSMAMKCKLTFGYGLLAVLVGVLL